MAFPQPADVVEAGGVVLLEDEVDLEKGEGRLGGDELPLLHRLGKLQSPRWRLPLGKRAARGLRMGCFWGTTSAR